MNPILRHAGLERVPSVRLADEVNKLRSSAQLSNSALNTLISALCASLKDAYDKTPAYIYDVEIVLPGGPSKSPSSKGKEDPRRSGDVQTEYGAHITSQPNPRKQELLEQAQALGCTWAKEEQEKRE